MNPIMITQLSAQLLQFVLNIFLGVYLCKKEKGITYVIYMSSFLGLVTLIYCIVLLIFVIKRKKSSGKMAIAREDSLFTAPVRRYSTLSSVPLSQAMCNRGFVDLDSFEEVSEHNF